ncbi:hypothetical protein P3T76_009291 [Phytophthora citrophthora]|uniref:Crinkler effector protein N-terminal domain-containing protein n=1 Tax=Phytophthora citrophthora TaxID=4793 RepID=A0AAD9GGM9_9STRA|nr:hypothetical protein P3T76_009291 [Phytophthora citrophthora]
MVKLFCAIVGTQGSAFPVNIGESESVGDLKKAIKVEKMYQFPADELQLFLSKKDKGEGAWLSEEDVATVRHDLVSQDYKLMKSTLLIKERRELWRGFSTG